ncbi:MAG: protein translocase subunit SecD [Alphaproteobacteria bacterium]|nr:protein translocase subunit SecD [Alphaproteobacteria bacterium]MCD8520078.1 protein translocase subunit SecD [Alphaproteobacteria bacterium]MCD8526546.1 protein translocase subunit SecD [Alphaproteobacteria bacterium]MCD8571341.1 protein translocase subunit SecD [Alphaproteobacteria bacterium]
MVQIATWKKILIILIPLLGLLYSLPNLLGAEMQASLKQNLPGWLPSKTVNLGLDLRGGAHLLYQVDTKVIFDERADLIVQDMRRVLREDKIPYTRIGSIENGMRLTLRDVADGEKARNLIRSTDPNLEIETKENRTIIEARLTAIAVKELLDQAIAQSIEIVRRRVDELGTTEPSIARQGEDRILLQVPGANAEDLKRIIGKTAKLTFHLVVAPGAGSTGGTKTLPFSDRNEGQNGTIERRAMITGDMLDNAAPGFDQNGQPVVSFRLNSVGGRKFCDVTRENVNRPFAIVLDEEIISAPVIREPICGGQGQISGGFDLQGATDLSILLRAGALPAPLKVIEERSVGPSLGADSVEAGKIAALVGFVLVVAFMIFYYGLFGLFASIALTFNVALIFGVLSLLQATLTLPGIAGIVLTIGMAVDANVLIFERIREEIQSGKSVIAAVDSGYKQAMSSIVDSNLTTLIAALVLFSFGTGPIKGFAVTLGIGVLTSMFSAVMMTRLIVITWLWKKKPSALPL